MNNYELSNEIKQKIEIIKDFANKMDYAIKEAFYDDYFNNRPMYGIDLIGTSDSDGNPFGWAWYLDTQEELR